MNVYLDKIPPDLEIRALYLIDDLLVDRVMNDASWPVEEEGVALSDEDRDTLRSAALCVLVRAVRRVKADQLREVPA